MTKYGETMEQSRSNFSAMPEGEEVAEYRKLSFLAVTSLLLGILSVASLLYPGVWIVPLLAIGCGVFGLRSIRKSDHVGGELAARAGIALALVFLCWAVSQYYFGRWVIYREAQVVAERWFDLVLQGEGRIAHQAMLHPTSRQSTGFSVDDYYQMDAKAREDMEKVFNSAPASELLGLGPDARVELVANVTQDVDVGNAKLIRQVYRVTTPNRPPIDAMITITREQRTDQDRVTWIVAEVESPK